jgi:hypothetical protein
LRIAVITAITGSRDGLKEAQNTEGADFFAFADAPLRSSTWQVLPACDLFRDPVRNAKAHKILSHLFFPQHDFSLWMDATLELVDPAPVLVERYLGDCDLVFGRHPIHRSLADEIEACLRETLDDPTLIRRQVAGYARASDRGVFPLASAVLRRHTPGVASFNETWWAEICCGSRRDQLSLLHAAERAGVAWGTFPRLPDLERDIRHRHLGSPHFRWFSHGADAAPPPELAPDDTLPHWSRARLEFLEWLCGEREAYALNLEAELGKREKWARETERYAGSLEEELARRGSYARSLEEELARRGGDRPEEPD